MANWYADTRGSFSRSTGAHSFTASEEAVFETILAAAKRPDFGLNSIDNAVLADQALNGDWSNCKAVKAAIAKVLRGEIRWTRQAVEMRSRIEDWHMNSR